MFYRLGKNVFVVVSHNAPRAEQLKSKRARGASAYRWPLDMIIDAGYAVATIYRGDVDPRL